MSKELVEYSDQIRSIMKQCDRVTKLAIESIDNLELGIQESKLKMNDFFAMMDLKNRRIDNLKSSAFHLGEFSKLVDTIDNDRLQLMQGARGSHQEFINNLEYIRAMDKYSWMMDSSNTAYKNYFRKYKMLMNSAEKSLDQEFKNVLKHYSTTEQMQSFIEYLLHKFEDTHILNESPDMDHSCISSLTSSSGGSRPNSSRSDTSNSVIKYDLFIPDETLNKLEQICWWFLRQEHQYELYDERGQHCDINEKLRFSEVRNEFLKRCLKTYSKMNSLGFTKNNHKLKQSMNKLFHSAIHSIQNQNNLLSSSNSSINSIASIGSNNLNQSTSSITSKLNNIHSNIQFRKKTFANILVNRKTETIVGLTLKHTDDSLYQKRQTIDLTNMIGSEDDQNSLGGQSKTFSKPVEFIEVFTDNLEFSLKLLQHENILIKSIYHKSNETRIELISKLTILVIDQIQNEFESFFTNSLDFSKLSNNGDNVIHAIIKLIVRVHNLKQKTNCLQTEDLPSAAKLLQFSLRLNDIGAQIFNSFLEFIRIGHFNEYDMPFNMSVHQYCNKVCDTWRHINDHERYILDSVKIVCEQNQSNLSLDLSNTGKKKLSKKENEDSEEIDEEEMAMQFRNNRRGRRDENPSQNDDSSFEKSPKWYLANYYLLIIEKLEHFLIDQSAKINVSTISTSAAFKNHLKSLKSGVFLINNIEAIMDFVNEINAVNFLIKVNPEFAEMMKNNLNLNIEKSLEVFKYIQSKWYKAKTTEDDNSEPKQGPTTPSQTLSSTGSFKLFKNPFNESKRKRKDDFLLLLRETLQLSIKLVIEKQSVNELFKKNVHSYIYNILESLESSGELNEVASILDINPTKNSTLSERIFDKLFPNSYL